MGAGMIDRQRGDREKAQEQPALERNEYSAESHGKNTGQIARAFMPEGLQRVIHAVRSSSSMVLVRRSFSIIPIAIQSHQSRRPLGNGLVIRQMRMTLDFARQVREITRN